MKTVMVVGSVLGAALAAAAPAWAEPALSIQDAAIRLTVIPEDRADVQVAIAHPNSRLPVSLRRQGEQVFVEGHRRGLACRNASVLVSWLFPVSVNQLPEIVAHVPRETVVTLRRSAVFGRIGPSQSLRMGASGCGRLTVGDVGGRLAINNAGSMTVQGGRAGRAEVSIAGSGDIRLGGVEGDVSARITGSGDFAVEGARSATVELTGSGDAQLGAVANGLNVTVVGSGDIAAVRVEGPVDAQIRGSGDITVRDGEATQLRAVIEGSGDLSFGGVAGSLDGAISGSGDIRVGRVTGAVTRRVQGSGSISVGS